MKKRAKPFNATKHSIESLTADGWTVGIVEQRIPHCFITRDFIGCIDLIAFKPSGGIMGVQVTGGTGKGNFNARVDKIKAEVTLKKPMLAPVSQGLAVGTLKLAVDDKPLGEYPLLVLEAVPAAGIFGRTWDGMRLWFQ